MKKHFKKLIVALIVLALGIWLLLPGDNEEQPKWRTATVTRGNISDVVTATGTLNPIELVMVGTQISGQVNKVHVAVNDQVKAGQLLAEIDPSLLMTQLRQDESSMETARVNYEQAKRDLERTRILLQKEYVARVDLERAEQTTLQARNMYESAKTQVERDKVNLGYAKIIAPIDGVVISQEVTTGQTVAASFQTPNMFKIAGDLTKMKIDVNLSEADISKVKAGMNVNFTVDAFRDREFQGIVDTVNVNPNTTQGVVTYTVVVNLENKDKALLPGMTAYVSITLSEVKDVLRVPAAALRFTPPEQKQSGFSRLFQGGMRPPRGMRGFSANNNEKPTIHLLRNGVLTPVEVKTGSADESNVEISGEGVAEGDIVVTGLKPKAP